MIFKKIIILFYQSIKNHIYFDKNKYNKRYVGGDINDKS